MSPTPNASKTTRVSAARSQASGNRTWWYVGAAIVVVGVAFVAAVAVSQNKKTSVATGSEAAAIVKKVTSVPLSVQTTVGLGGVTYQPKKLTGAALTAGGKPEVLFIGAEYCPYCATERWAVVNALSRFGTFTNLGMTASSSSDVFPNTPTFTFYRSSFTSKYLTFTAVETETNKPDSNGGYQKLQTPTAAQTKLFTTVGDGSIPFIDIGGKYLTSGATYDAQVLQGKSAAEIASAMHDPSTDIAKGSIGSANLLTALICQATGQQPGAVCKAPAVKEITAALS